MRIGEANQTKLTIKINEIGYDAFLAINEDAREFGVKWFFYDCEQNTAIFHFPERPRFREFARYLELRGVAEIVFKSESQVA